MKKTLVAFLAFLAVISLHVCASAAPGDVVGEIYSTDILAVINGEPIESYNIGGRTAIIAEDLYDEYYGFAYEYNDSTRTLYVYTSYEVSPRDRGVDRGKVGEIIGNIYETDIKVIFNGHEVPGYNIGGRTAVVIEDLGAMDGTSPNEQYGYSKYLCNFTWDNDTRTVTLDTLTDNYSSDKLVPSVKHKCNDNIITVSYSPDNNYFSGMDFSISDSYVNRTYQIEPLYLEHDQQKTEVGLFYAREDLGGYFIAMTNIDYDKLNGFTASLKGETQSYDEITEKFLNADKYRIVTQCETENYKCMLIEYKTDDSKQNIHLISVSKSGGYITLGILSSGYTVLELEKTGTDKVNLIYGPIAGTPGSGLLNVYTEYDLSQYQY